jgi:hypothetical protein
LFFLMHRLPKLYALLSLSDSTRTLISLKGHTIIILQQAKNNEKQKKARRRRRRRK